MVRLRVTQGDRQLTLEDTLVDEGKRGADKRAELVQVGAKVAPFVQLCVQPGGLKLIGVGREVGAAFSAASKCFVQRFACERA